MSRLPYSVREFSRKCLHCERSAIEFVYQGAETAESFPKITQISEVRDSHAAACTILCMACRGVLFAITQEQAQSLRAARGDDDRVLSIVQDEIEEAWDEAHLRQTDKAWDAIHRCLGDGTLRSGNGSLSLCILGGEPLHEGDSYIISLLTPEQVNLVAKALRPIDQEWLRNAYFKIDAADYTGPGQLSEEDFAYTWDYFEGVRDFYEKAAAEGRWSIFTVDQ